MNNILYNSVYTNNISILKGTVIVFEQRSTVMVVTVAIVLIK